MSVTVHLVRHCPQPRVHDVLCGRACDDGLDENGRRKAAILSRALAEELSPARIDSSPRRRALETARTIAEATKADVTVAAALDEIDFGDWAGRSFQELDGDVRWRFWNSARDRACSPGGETMYDAVARAVDHLNLLADDLPGGTAICVTHADIIRGIIAHYIGMGFDRILNIDIDPGSVSTIVLDRTGGRVASLNRVYA